MHQPQPAILFDSFLIFSCMFLIPNIFFPIWLFWFMYYIWESYRNKLKNHSVRGHSTTTWKEFCNYLTPPPPCVESFIPSEWTKTDIFDPLHFSSCPRSYWMNPYQKLFWPFTVWIVIQHFSVKVCQSSIGIHISLQFGEKVTKNYIILFKSTQTTKSFSSKGKKKIIFSLH